MKRYISNYYKANHLSTTIHFSIVPHCLALRFKNTTGSLSMGGGKISNGDYRLLTFCVLYTTSFVQIKCSKVILSVANVLMSIGNFCALVRNFFGSVCNACLSVVNVLPAIVDDFVLKGKVFLLTLHVFMFPVKNHPLVTNSFWRATNVLPSIVIALIYRNWF